MNSRLSTRRYKRITLTLFSILMHTFDNMQAVFDDIRLKITYENNENVELRVLNILWKTLVLYPIDFLGKLFLGMCFGLP